MNFTWHDQTYGIAPGVFWSMSAIAAIIFIIVFILKAYALWTAARRNEKWWFIILIVVNTVGILEIVYLAFVAKKWSKPTLPPSSSPTATQ